jgi:hypothetical protein
MKRSVHMSAIGSVLLGAMLLGWHPSAICAQAAVPADGIRVQGPGSAPTLGFACCDHGIPSAQALLADPETIADLKDIHAEIAVPTVDFSPERAQIVRGLNQAGIPVVAWIMLPEEQGIYPNADNEPQAAARFVAFEDWTRAYDLHWAMVGLDIEPNFTQLAALKGHWFRLAGMLIGRSMDGARVLHARRMYAGLIGNIRSQGYSVQTYQMPFIAAERKERSTVLDRLLGTVDVPSDEEYMMIYTSFAPSHGAGMIWELGPESHAIAVGITEGDPSAGSFGAALNWQEFSDDLIVAGHFSRKIGVYNLEGCVKQGFLPRLKTMDWSQSVPIPQESMRRARRLSMALDCVLWIGSRFAYFAAGILMLIAWLAWRWRVRRGRRMRLNRGEPNPLLRGDAPSPDART